MSNVSYNLGNHKPLINRDQTYVLDRKLITIHSEDRDISKWKFPFYKSEVSKDLYEQYETIIREPE